MSKTIREQMAENAEGEPYVTSDGEDAQLEAFTRQLEAFAAVCKNEGLQELLHKMPQARKSAWAENLAPIIYIRQIVL